jgi:glucose-6-phosphate 1-dehydrogenase
MSTYISGQYDKDEGFIELRKHIEEREGKRENRNRYGSVKVGRILIARIFYMALPPNVFTPVAQGLKKNVYPEKGIARLIVQHIIYLIDSRSKNHSVTISSLPETFNVPLLQSGKKTR